MARSFQQAEHEGWVARAIGYDEQFTMITDQVIEPILSVFGEISGTRLLDVCCGPGHLVGSAAACGADAIGLDFAASMVAIAQNRYPGLSFVEGDAATLPFKDETFDNVVCAYGVMHLPNPEAAMAEAFRVLRPGGRYCFTQWAMDDELLGLVTSAISTHGEPVADMPKAPPPMRFSDPNECRRVLSRIGFEKVTIDTVRPIWTGAQPADVLRLIMESAVRAAMLIEAQAPERRTRIEAAIMAGVAEKATDGQITVHRPSVLAHGRRPE